MGLDLNEHLNLNIGLDAVGADGVAAEVADGLDLWV